ncbi:MULTISPECIES: phospholipase [Pseudomonas]|uniref:phospholipase n=1 Tax=Pseudomonas TaxID=286 RepID=UPI0008769F1C|nr:MULTISPECIES: phospholipase [Pseudomonas]SCZ39414.1 1-phosphatidylinositol phosphodiesterase [Pseudomonas sp. NFIX46]SDB49355.1 1-phosphatidylinositol phosphodiesterase [Pseudomonas putida]SFQ94130.1 1-phosphatidylinositol phosphodiesterase [Pseudomonas sp. NFIX49]
MNNFLDNNFELHNWMAATPAIDDLSLTEMTLPGAHNAGCDREASYAVPLAETWIACQDVPIYAQLNRGARALDLRLGYYAKADDMKKFQFQHSGYLSSRHLGDLVIEIESFLERNRDEFIILDFHELNKGSDEFDYQLFNDTLLKKLGDRIIPVENRHLALHELKAASPLQRLLVAAPYHHQLDRRYFCDRIPHSWINKEMVSVDDLYQYIKSVMKAPPGGRPWSLSATCYGIIGPLRILDELDNWFDPDKTEWAQRCSIINFDFIKNSRIVSFCRTANLAKARRKI